MIELYILGAWLLSLFIFIWGAEKYSKRKELKAMTALMVAVPAGKPMVISEPVTSFIKCFKDNPKRFKLICTDSANWWILKDNLTKKEWTFTASNWDGWYHLYIEGKGYDWLTDDERTALYLGMYPYLVTRRRERLHAIQRQRLTRIYKEKPNV